MKQRELTRQGNFSIGKQSNRVKVVSEPVHSDLPIYGLLSIVQEAINSPYANDELWKHVEDFGMSLDKDVRDVAQMALRGFLLSLRHK